jgi:hypothetical protein
MMFCAVKSTHFRLENDDSTVTVLLKADYLTNQFIYISFSYLSIVNCGFPKYIWFIFELGDNVPSNKCT